MGCMDAVVAAIKTLNKDPDSKINLVLINPAGMIGKDSTMKLGKRFLENIKQTKRIGGDLGHRYTSKKRKETRPESTKDNISIAGEEFFKYIKENSIRAIKEIMATANFQINDLLTKLKKHGVGISIIQGVDDRTFPSKKINANTNSGEVDGYYSVAGGHNELYLYPEKFMTLAENAITALENRPSREPA